MRNKDNKGVVMGKVMRGHTNEQTGGGDGEG